MTSLFVCTEQMVKAEQYKDLLREAEHHRLVKAIAQPSPKHLQRVATVPRPALVGPGRDVPSLRPAS